MRRHDLDESELADLLRAAGARPELPADEIAAARAAARRAFAAQAPAATNVVPFESGRRLRPRALAGWLAAAAVVLAAIGFWALRPRALPRPASGSTVLATVERLAGAAAVRVRSGAEPSALAVGTPLARGARIETASALDPARLSLRLAGGASLRVAAGSVLELAAPDRFVLHAGALYLDVEPAARGTAPAIETVHGRFVDLGTQFELALLASGSARLRVREGRVELRNGRILAAEAGEELAVARDGSAARATVAKSGEAWAWAVAAAPMPAIDGWTLGRFLAWFARESALEIELADPAARERARAVTVHGAIDHLDPFAAAEVVLASAGCRSSIEGDRMVVRAEAGGER